MQKRMVHPMIALQRAYAGASGCSNTRFLTQQLRHAVDSAMQIPQAKWRAMMESATGATFPVPLWSTRLDQLYTAAWKSHNRALDMVRPPGPPVPQPCPRHGAAP
eukprot:9365421-Pyramimonas_sp.AAC.1